MKYTNMNDYMEAQAAVCAQADQIDKELYLKYGVKRGLRDLNGKGVLTGLTNISSVVAFKESGEERIPCRRRALVSRLQCDGILLPGMEMVCLDLRRRLICFCLESFRTGRRWSNSNR